MFADFPCQLMATHDGSSREQPQLWQICDVTPYAKLSTVVSRYESRMLSWWLQTWSFGPRLLYMCLGMANS